MRKRREEGEAMGSDSFLDVVANMVGIIIILVLVAGLRSRQAPERVAEQIATGPEMRAVVEQEAQAKTLRDDVQRLAGDIAIVNAQVLMAFDERNALAFEAAYRQQQLDERRQALDARRRDEFDLDRQLAVAQDELAKLQRQRQAALDAPTKTVQVTNYATPISRTVQNKEAHFQLRGGRIAYVPMDDFIERMPDELKQQAWKLRQQPEATGTIGPIDGFRMKYLLVRDGNMVRLQQFELLPVRSDLGEPLSAALSAEGEFSRVVAGLNRRRTTVTLWTYPDSFAEFRALKDHLHTLGFATAGRPLPEGFPIGGSIYGTRSAAE